MTSGTEIALTRRISRLIYPDTLIMTARAKVLKPMTASRLKRMTFGSMDCRYMK